MASGVEDEVFWGLVTVPMGNPDGRRVVEERKEEDGYRRHTAVLVRSAVLSPPCPVGDVGSQDRHRPLARSALSWIGRALEFSSFCRHLCDVTLREKGHSEGNRVWHGEGL